MAKKIEQQNLRPQVAPAGTPKPQPSAPAEAAQPEEPLADAEQGKSFFSLFGSPSLLGAGVLGIALVSAAVPYSLGWLTPKETAEASENLETDDDLGNPEYQEEFQTDFEFPETNSFPPEDEHSVNKANHLGPPPLETAALNESGYGNLSEGLEDLPSFDDQVLPDLSADEFSAAGVAPGHIAPESTDNFSLSAPAAKLGAPALPPPQTFAAQPLAQQAPVRQPQPQPQMQREAPPPRPHNPPQHAIVGINEADITHKAPQDEPPRSPYGHSIQNVKMQRSGSESYEPQTVYPMSENDPSLARNENEFEEPDFEPLDSQGDDAFGPPDRLAARTSHNRSDVQPRYANSSLQDERDPFEQRGERITPPPASHPQSRQQSQPPPRSHRDAREPYQLKYAHRQVRQDVRGLPNDHGQLWCEYDISSFTKGEGVPPGSLPEQAIVNWIKKQTGEQIWHAEPFGILSASSDTLYVYHTPKVQNVIAQVVDRFVNPHAGEEVFTFRIVSLNGPNWLSQSHGLLKPIRIDSPGTRGWLLEKEDHARLIPELSRRSDYKELCSPQFPIRNGREYVVSSSVPKNYTPDAQPQNNVWPGYATEMSVINEGYKLSLTPLLSVDSPTADIMIQCESLQVEKMHSISLNVSNRASSRQRIPVEAPQIAQFHLEEQIVWPKDKILLLSLGTVPVPAAAQFNDADKLIPGISRKISGASATRGHILLVVECRKL